MEKTLYPLRGIVTTVISCFEGENKVLDLDSVANEIDMACKAGVSGFHSCQAVIEICVRCIIFLD